MLRFPPQKRAVPMPTSPLQSIDFGIVSAQAAKAASQLQRPFRSRNLNAGIEN